METRSTVRLSDQREIGYCRYGDAKGPVVVCLHGFPGSRSQFRFLQTLGDLHHLDLIVLERPGFGVSTRNPKRKISEWGKDVLEVVDHLRPGATYSVLGVSGGAPYALSAAAASKRVRNVALVSPLGPIGIEDFAQEMPGLSRFGIKLARSRNPLLHAAFFVSDSYTKYSVQKMIELIAKGLNDSDQKALTTPTFVDGLSTSFLEATLQGIGVLVDDLRVLSEPWDFDPSKIEAPIRIWHGDEDRIVPVAMGRKLAKLLPRSQYVEVSGEGHYSLAVTRASEIILASV